MRAIKGTITEYPVQYKKPRKKKKKVEIEVQIFIYPSNYLKFNGLDTSN